MHFASKAAALAGDTPERPRAAKLRVHKKANAAKHAWSPKERSKPKEHVFDVDALAFFPAIPPGHWFRWQLPQPRPSATELGYQRRLGGLGKGAAGAA